MKEKIQNACLEILPNIKHCPYLECPELLVEKVKEFLL
jgi:pimeloyl-ACP methyl ester carboxylesterase